MRNFYEAVLPRVMCITVISASQSSTLEYFSEGKILECPIHIASKPSSLNALPFKQFDKYSLNLYSLLTALI